MELLDPRPPDESSLAIPIDDIREVKSSLGASFEK